jgi:hypothetical protein
MIMACAARGSAAEMAEAYYVVKVQDMTKISSHKVVSAKELKELEKEIQTESQCFPKALEESAKAWKADEANKGTAFPGGRVTPRKIVGAPERFSNEEKAKEKLKAIEDAEIKKAERESEKETAKAKKSNKNSKANKKTSDEIAKESKRESDTLAANELVQKKLNEIVAAKSVAPSVGGK